MIRNKILKYQGRQLCFYNIIHLQIYLPFSNITEGLIIW